MKWPFKHLKKTSSWPMQPFVVQFAAAVLQAPAEEREACALKMIERCVRMGSRLAVEFGLPAPAFVDIARAMIVKEGGKDAEAALAVSEGTGEVVVLTDDEDAQKAAEAAYAALSGDEVPEA